MYISCHLHLTRQRQVHMHLPTTALLPPTGCTGTLSFNVQAYSKTKSCINNANVYLPAHAGTIPSGTCQMKPLTWCCSGYPCAADYAAVPLCALPGPLQLQ